MNVCNQLTESVKALACRAGFARVGVTSALALRGLEKFKGFLAAGFAAQMDYLDRNIDKRFDPTELVSGAKSVISLAVSYAPPEEAKENGGAFVSCYARGRDYHKVLKNRCHGLMDAIRRIAPQFEGRAFVDSAPIAERSAAAEAGLGWIGRNGCLIAPGLGSYVFLAEIVCNLELQIDEPIDGSCGDCRACIDACPTGACIGDGLVDARRCYSYLTIEHAGPIDDEFHAKWGSRVFGCDDCQRVCPHNKDIPAGDGELTGADCPQVRNLNGCDISEILQWSPENWDFATRGSATRRAPLESFVRNAKIASDKSD